MTPELRRRLDWALTVYRNSRVQHEATIHNILVECNDALSALPPPGQEWESTERHIDEILRIATQDMTAAFGDSAEQYRREAIKAVLAAENWAGVCYERRRTAGQEWRDEEIRAETFDFAAKIAFERDDNRTGEALKELASEIRKRVLPAPPVAEPKETP